MRQYCDKCGMRVIDAEKHRLYCKGNPVSMSDLLRRITKLESLAQDLIKAHDTFHYYPDIARKFRQLADRARELVEVRP